ncbi:hypothetical protein KFE94_15430 [bacterium SCSIO 12643]|nr:hypothetical protein KFE94_15430 [bacterium SCSIO 12643]
MEQKQKAIILLVVGILLVGLIQMFNYLTEVTDWVVGIVLGTGIGLLAVSVIKLQKLRKIAGAKTE